MAVLSCFSLNTHSQEPRKSHRISPLWLFPSSPGLLGQWDTLGRDELFYDVCVCLYVGEKCFGERERGKVRNIDSCGPQGDTVRVCENSVLRVASYAWLCVCVWVCPIPGAAPGTVHQCQSDVERVGYSRSTAEKPAPVSKTLSASLYSLYILLTLTLFTNHHNLLINIFTRPDLQQRSHTKVFNNSDRYGCEFKKDIKYIYVYIF